MKKTKWITACMAAMATLALLAMGCSNGTDEEPEPGLGYDADGWLIKDGAVRHYRGTAEEVKIPDGVTSIGDGAFYRCSGLTSVTIPDSVTSVGENAFRECTNLTGVTIGDGVESIGTGAFNYCNNLTDVYYAGTEDAWKKIKGIYDCGLSSRNMNVTIHGKDADGKETTWTAQSNNG